MFLTNFKPQEGALRGPLHKTDIDWGLYASIQQRTSVARALLADKHFYGPKGLFGRKRKKAD